MFLKFIHFFWLSNLLLCNCSEYSLIIPCISVVSVVMSPLSFFYLSLLSFSLSLALEFFSILLIFSLKNQFLFFSILYHFSCLYFTYLCSDFFWLLSAMFELHLFLFNSYMFQDNFCRFTVTFYMNNHVILPVQYKRIQFRNSQIKEMHRTR